MTNAVIRTIWDIRGLIHKKRKLLDSLEVSLQIKICWGKTISSCLARPLVLYLVYLATFTLDWDFTHLSCPLSISMSVFSKSIKYILQLRPCMDTMFINKPVSVFLPSALRRLIYFFVICRAEMPFFWKR